MAGDEYPKWLIERVAEAIARGMDEGHEAAAVAVLDALEFRKRFSSGQLIAGKYVAWTLMDLRTNYYCYRAQTEWKQVDDA